MAVLNAQEGVQYPVTASGVINWDDTLPSGVAISTVAVHVIDLATLPGNAIVVGGKLTKIADFATTGTCTIDLGDDGVGGTADPNRYTQAGAVDLEAAGADVTALPTATALAYRTIAVCTLQATLTVGTAALTGGGPLYWSVEYIVVPGRTHETIG